MKKVLIIIAVLSTLLLSGCNRQLVDTSYSFKKAYIENIGEVEVASWTDYDNSDMIQVKDKNGVTYLTHSSNVILMSK